MIMRNRPTCDSTNIRWVQFPALTLLIGVILMRSLNSHWIFCVPSDSQFQRPTEICNISSLHSEKNLNHRVNKTGEIFCLRDCAHLKVPQSQRPGLEMIRFIYDHLPEVKAKHRLPSPHLKPLVRKWKTLLTNYGSVENSWQLANKKLKWWLMLFLSRMAPPKRKWGSSQTLINDSDEGLANILSALRTSRVTYSDVGFRGTQLKISLTLEGGQTVVFKPRRSKNNAVIEGDVYSGTDRHQGEVVAFHLSLLLNMTTVPLVVGRKLSLRSHILPVASKQLSKTVFIRGRSTCFYGVCNYCRVEDPVCDDGYFLDGAVILWLPRHLRLVHLPSPWARTYNKNKLAKWELDREFCHHFTPSFFSDEKFPLLLNLIDACVFDFLIQNGDRHHYSLVSTDPQSAIIMLDNGKSFGDPYVDHLDVLAPLSQCCRIRRRTYNRLLLFSGGGFSKALDELLATDTLYPVISDLHLKAIDRRLYFVLAAIEMCQRTVGDAIFS